MDADEFIQELTARFGTLSNQEREFAAQLLVAVRKLLEEGHSQEEVQQMIDTALREAVEGTTKQDGKLNLPTFKAAKAPRFIYGDEPQTCRY